ncbi:ABC transporter substrate-binding protein [Ligilactobacillus animalis]|uniref:ABC transporter substrate-binding protein n=3 Tax=Ligilactobacillus animalis TaxID=1605 RepID=A0AAJ6FY42_9LACO|nr:ABC transporter substrate-binding protein [Ligilactobacillus animalis]MDO5883393.1 ABC transporter substrate-binding protein [Ligilactobacillus animalis]MDU1487184.1 ABC transporter substrate-binding protein [Ligilactobacillus animalis]MDU8986316.1 ABC transporter substrate-binding protein [Ligilactobacillus animalis]WHQ80111.1 ABC transporter substrate-binding protein [Ligilactobacillus animalis]WKB72616.1 ABC transporter substrate-binding protein [Ligilactobacillus animalis]
MKNKKFLQRLAVVTAVSLMTVSSVQPLTAKAVSFPDEYVNHKKALKNATLRVGYASDEPFKGIFIDELDSDGKTSVMAAPGSASLFGYDNDGKYVAGGFGNVKFDRKNNTALISITKKARWSDGEPVTSRDAAYAYEIQANKDSNSPYYNEMLENIEGVKEYHEGKADKITGLEEKDSKHLLIHFKELTPAAEYAGSGYVANVAYPYHYLKDVPFDKLVSSDKVRKHPLFFGPYAIKKIVQGESIEWVSNKYYGGPKPKLAKIITEIVPLSQAATAMKSGKYDVLLNTSSATYNKIKDDKKLVTLGSLGTGITYLGFKVGHADKDGKSVMDKSLPISNRALRQAMAYAMNVEAVTKKFGHGVTKHANTLISPNYGTYHDKSVKAYNFNLKKANELLDKAGFKRGKDGYRTQPNGKKLVLTMLDQKGSESNVAARANYIQLWKKVGLNVKLYSGKALEYNNYLDVLSSNKKHNFDLWTGVWSLPPEPTSYPSYISAPTSELNYGHFTSKENDKLVAQMNSQKAFNTKYRIQQMHKWQQYMQKEAYVVPLYYQYDLETVGKNVKNISADATDVKYNLWDQVALTK